MEKRCKVQYGEFDCENYPLIKFTVIDCKPTVADIREYNAAFLNSLRHSEGKFILLVDATNAKWMSSRARVEMGERQKEIEREFAYRTDKLFIVIPNSVMRMMLKGINVIAKTVIEQVVFSSVEEAEKAAKKEVALINAD